MATFIVEDGTGVANANALTTVAFVDEYFDTRGNTVWAAASIDSKQQAIVRSSDYIETAWADLFKGNIEFADQELSFPRVNLFDRNNRAVEGMPKKLQQAVSEYSLRALSSSLYIEPTTQANGQLVQKEKKKIAPIEKEITYVEGGSFSTLKDIPEADNLLLEYVSSGDKVIRA